MNTIEYFSYYFLTRKTDEAQKLFFSIKMVSQESREYDSYNTL